MRFNGRRLSFAVGLFQFGCASLFATPRAEDAPATRDSFQQMTRSGQACDPPIEMLESESIVRLRYREVASLSATCYPGALTVCKRRLAQRACELHANAVILSAPTPGGTPPGSSGQSLMSLSGRAVRWELE